MSKTGRFVWFDLMTSDRNGAVSFYSTVLGLQAEVWSGDDGYSMFKASDDLVGGVAELPEAAREAGTPCHWLGYIQVEDAAAVVDAIGAEGGKVIKDTETIEEVGGRFAVLSDPTGAVFAVYQSKNEDERDLSGRRIGHVAWVELASTDHKKGLAFYARQFGWTSFPAQQMEGPVAFDMFGTDPTPMGTAYTLENGQGPSHWLFYFRVQSVAKTIETAVANGATLISGPIEVPGDEIVAQLTDPQGAAFAIVGAA